MNEGQTKKDDPVQRGHGPGGIPKGAFADMGPDMGTRKLPDGSTYPATTGLTFLENPPTEPPAGVLLTGVQPAELLKFLNGEKFDASVIAEIKLALEQFVGF